MDVFFATNREQTVKSKGYFGERFHADGPMFYRVGHASLSSTGSADPDEGYTVNTVEVFEEKLGRKDEEDRKLLGSTEFFKTLQKNMRSEAKDVIVLIHGFACGFEDALKRAAQIKQSYLIEPAVGTPYEPYVVVFSWPANGRVFPPWEYHSDRDDAHASGMAIARFIMRLLDFLADGKPCPQRIHLVAHSMGNWALRHTVQSLCTLNGQGRFPTILTNAFLMAADEDEDTFEFDSKLGRLPELARSIHVYHASNDRALVISDDTKFNPNRLGSNGPRSFSGLSNRIVAIDCHAVSETKLEHGNHQYYRIRKEVIADVRAVLSGRYLPDQIPGRAVTEPGRRYRIDAPVAAMPAPVRRGPPRKPKG